MMGGKDILVIGKKGETINTKAFFSKQSIRRIPACSM